MYKGFFCKNKKNEQEGLYGLLVVKKKIPAETVVESLLEYSKRYINWTKRCPEDRKFIIDCATCSDNFNKFLAIVTEKTGITFKRRPSRKRRDSYDEWWQESNMDGSFAYSGVTDDY